ncbi:MAG: GAF domain-containing protein [Armatimonadota bacterium]|nr:GAF domain-containing protein [Armatimonadota bacterium]MDR7439016.1 GAF domain-containing protein [Armatimonadota bacterium]MDR7563610.1 GAF domain-containing protein [Armatimonadota bacterium]MDR7566858.1 GAF domain-containing protein [Armatimonadota bacterium]MDR7601215.1 GAF domain-containing protein [Armatimonadota bacterium]
MRESALRTCQEALRRLRGEVPFDLGTIWLRTHRGILPAASVGRPLDLLEQIPFRAGMGLRAWILETGRAVRIPSRSRGLRTGSLRGFLAIPAEHAGQRVAVVVLGRAEGAFTDAEERAVQAAAEELARALGALHA